MAASRVTVSPGEDFGLKHEGFSHINAALLERDLMRALERLCEVITVLASN